MKRLAAIFCAWVIFAAPATAQCTAPGCELATAVVLQARATGRAVLTAEAPPTSTPAPTATPWPTSTAVPTWTPQATQTPKPTFTPEPTQTSAPTATDKPTTSTPVAVPQRTTVGDDLLVIAAGVVILIALGLITVRYFKPRQWIEPHDREKGRWDR